MKIRLPALEKRRRGPVAEEADEEEDADEEVVAYVEEEADVEETDEEQETDDEQETDEEEESAIAADPDWLPPLDEDSQSQEQ